MAKFEGGGVEFNEQNDCHCPVAQMLLETIALFGRTANTTRRLSRLLLLRDTLQGKLRNCRWNVRTRM